MKIAPLFYSFLKTIGGGDYEIGLDEDEKWSSGRMTFSGKRLLLTKHPPISPMVKHFITIGLL